jgi:hypothetical protein
LLEEPNPNIPAASISKQSKIIGHASLASLNSRLKSIVV